MTHFLCYPPVVAFAGPKRAGKGTATSYLLSLGYQQVSFAHPLKEMLLVLGLTEADLTNTTLKEAPHSLLGGQTPRWAMQSLGTEWGRQMIYDGIWVGVAEHRVRQWRDQGSGVVIDDCRFDNEAVFLRGIGAPIIEITRAGYAYSPGHKSEAGISRGFVTATIANDGTPEQLHARLDAVLRGLIL